MFQLMFIVSGLIFTMSPDFMNGDFKVNYNSQVPMCASVSHPQSIEHIITEGHFYKILKSEGFQLVQGKTYSGRMFQKDHREAVMSLIEKHCHGIKKIGKAY